MDAGEQGALINIAQSGRNVFAEVRLGQGTFCEVDDGVSATGRARVREEACGCRPRKIMHRRARLLSLHRRDRIEIVNPRLRIK